MPDNYTTAAGSGGDTFAADELLGGIKVPRVKLMLGEDGVNGSDISASNPMPATVSGVATAANQSTMLGRMPALTDGRVPVLAQQVRIGLALTARVNASTSSVQLLASRADRSRIVIYNESTAQLRVKFGQAASAGDYTYLLQPGDTYESPAGAIYTGRIDGIWSAANGAAQLTEM